MFAFFLATYDTYQMISKIEFWMKFYTSPIESDQIFLVWVSSQTNIFWSGKSKLSILVKITGYDFKNSVIFCKYTLKLNCNRLKNIWRSFNFVFIDSDQIFVLVWVFCQTKIFWSGPDRYLPTSGDDPENENFRKISGWVFHDLPIRVKWFMNSVISASWTEVSWIITFYVT